MKSSHVDSLELISTFNLSKGVSIRESSRCLRSSSVGRLLFSRRRPASNSLGNWTLSRALCMWKHRISSRIFTQWRMAKRP